MIYAIPVYIAALTGCFSDSSELVERYSEAPIDSEAAMPVTNPDTGKRDYEFRPCKFGIDNGIDVEVIEGLQPGDEVYVRLPQKTQKEKEAEEEAGD